MIRQDTALAAERLADTFGGGGFVAEVYFIQPVWTGYFQVSMVGPRRACRGFQH
jgi:hypothetical protein